MKRHFFASASALLVLPLILSACSKEEEVIAETPLPQVVVKEMRPGLSRSFSVTGEVTANEVSRITGEFRATVEQVHVQIGSKVQKGDILLTLDSPSIEASFLNAEDGYTQAALNLQQTRVNADRTVKQAEVALETAKTNLSTTLRENGAKRIQAQETLKAAKLNLDLSLAQDETSLQNAIRSAFSTVDAALKVPDKILEFSPEYTDINDIRETHIGVRDPIFMRNVRDHLGTTFRLLGTSQSTYIDAKTLLEETDVIMDRTLQILRLSVTSPQYTEVQLDTELSEVISNQQAIKTAIASLDNAKRSLDLTRKHRGFTSQTLIDAETNYISTIATLDRSDESARRALREAEIGLESARSSAAISATAARSQLSTASGQRDQAAINDDKRTVQALFDGVVTDIPVVVGDEVDPGTLLVTTENPGTLKITVFLSASEIGNVVVGQDVILGDGTRSSVRSVSPSADPQTKKYKVEIIDPYLSLQPGTFTTVTFSAENTEDARFFLPVSSIEITGTDSTVWIVQSDTEKSVVERVSLELGNLEGQYVEILSGITSGDLVVIEGGRLLEDDGEEVEIAELQ